MTKRTVRHFSVSGIFQLKSVVYVGVACCKLLGQIMSHERAYNFFFLWKSPVSLVYPGLCSLKHCIFYFVSITMYHLSVP